MITFDPLKNKTKICFRFDWKIFDNYWEQNDGVPQSQADPWRFDQKSDLFTFELVLTKYPERAGMNPTFHHYKSNYGIFLCYTLCEKNLWYTGARYLRLL